MSLRPAGCHGAAKASPDQTLTWSSWATPGFRCFLIKLLQEGKEAPPCPLARSPAVRRRRVSSGAPRAGREGAGTPESTPRSVAIRAASRVWDSAALRWSQSESEGPGTPLCVPHSGVPTGARVPRFTAANQGSGRDCGSEWGRALPVRPPALDSGDARVVGAAL
ncbi:hypothetical protein NN561_014863 [Cricetulus griseus]